MEHSKYHHQIYVILAANGNGTVIQVLDEGLTRLEYEELGKKLLADNEKFNAEQAGFLILKDNHFEMAGGEFCGNGARAAALLFSKIIGRTNVDFTMSGFKNTISGEVLKTNTDKKYRVSCIFPGLDLSIKKVETQEYSGTLVDLGGIIHYVVEAEFPKNFEEIHRSITKQLKLENRDAVGVVWFQKNGNYVTMHPVVWVNAIDSFFYETSCGSGTIAVSKVTGARFVKQPSGGEIEALFFGDRLTLLKSDMEVTHGTL